MVYNTYMYIMLKDFFDLEIVFRCAWDNLEVKIISFENKPIGTYPAKKNESRNF